MLRSWLFAIVAFPALAGWPQYAGATRPVAIGRAPAAQVVSVTVHLPLRNEATLDALLRMQADRSSPLYHHFLSVAQFRAAFGPSPRTLAVAVGAVNAAGLHVTAGYSASLRVSGPAANIERTFRTQLAVIRDAAGRSHLASQRALTMPSTLRVLGATVTGLEPHVEARVDSRIVPLNRRSAFGAYYFDDLKQAYSYPSDTVLDGKGTVVGVLMSSDVLDSDTQAEFAHERYVAISGHTPPPLLRRVVFGGAPFGGIDDNASGEASLDVQTAQGSAPGAQIALYNVPTLGDDALIAGYTDVVEDDFVDVLSSSFSLCELVYTAAYNGGTDYTGVLRAFAALFKQGNAEGITFVASSGDSAGLPCPNLGYYDGTGAPAFIPSVSFPADDPNVTAVGGTNLQTTAPPLTQTSPPILTSAYITENADADAEVPYDPYGFGVTIPGGYWGSGSGASAIWSKPWYQYLVPTSGGAHRVVPDVAMQMGGCPYELAQLPCQRGDSSSIYYVGGAQYAFIGTSLSAPEFAGLLALRIESEGSRLGNVNPELYRLAAAQASAGRAGSGPYFHQTIEAYNGVVRVAGGVLGVSPVIGVGTPIARNFIGVPNVALAGDPQTLSNP